MAKKADMKLLGVRISPELMASIDLVVNFEDASIQELFYDVVVARAEQLTADPDIKAALDAKGRYQARKGRKVLPIKSPKAHPAVHS